jgi:hypothetical protein
VLPYSPDCPIIEALVVGGIILLNKALSTGTSAQRCPIRALRVNGPHSLFRHRFTRVLFETLRIDHETTDTKHEAVTALQTEQIIRITIGKFHQLFTKLRLINEKASSLLIWDR